MSSIEQGTPVSAAGVEPRRSGDDRTTPVCDQQLQILTDRNRDRARVRVNGEIDHDSAPLLLSVLAQALHGRVDRLEVDLAGVRFCDCAGLNVLLQTRRHAEDSGVVMTLVRASPAVQRLLDLTGARTVFTLTEPDPCAQASA